MSVAELQYTGALTITTCWCGMKHAIATELYDYARRKQDDGEPIAIHCPLGHKWLFAGESTAARLRREKDQLAAKLAWADQRKAELQTELQTAQRQTAAQKANVTKMKKRAAKGVCPCCNRFFVELSRHMQTVHPDVFNDQ